MIVSILIDNKYVDVSKEQADLRLMQDTKQRERETVTGTTIYSVYFKNGRQQEQTIQAWLYANANQGKWTV